MGHIAETGKAILPSINRIGVTELLDDLRKDYEISGTRTLREVDQRLKPLYAFFAGYKASAVKGPLLTKYAHARQVHGTSNATINRERSTLIRALKSAHKTRKSCRARRFINSRNRIHARDFSNETILSERENVSRRDQIYNALLVSRMHLAGDARAKFSRYRSVNLILKSARSDSNPAWERRERPGRCI